jgi:hypothetical protein
MVTLVISKLSFPNNGSILNQITVDLFIKGYYQPDSSYSLIDNSVLVDVNGAILDSPLPSVSIDPTQKYVLKAVNDLCGFVYTQEVIIYPYCPSGYQLAMDESFCYLIQTVPATPPSASQNTVAVTNGAYTNFGTYIYSSGYNINGTGTSTQINPSNAFWINPLDNTTDGPLNRSGVWATTTSNNQDVGFSVCITVPIDTTYYVGIGIDNYGILNLDGKNIVTQDVAALQAQYNPTYPGIGPAVTFKIWHIYPVFLAAGTHVLEMIGHNVDLAAAIGCEIYNLTPTQIAAATSYGSMGSGLIFSSKDYVGRPVQIGSGGIGWSCPSGYSLKYCDSPPDCIRTLTTPILY